MNKLFKYLKESKEEFKKVTWPTKKVTINYSLLVIAISVFLAVFIGLSDFILSLGLEKVVETYPTTLNQEVDTNTVTPDIQVDGVQVETASPENN